jgi:integrase
MLVDLKRKMIKDRLDTLQVGIKTLSNIQSCLRSGLTDAVDEKLIELNPLAGWTYSRKKLAHHRAHCLARLAIWCNSHSGQAC